MPGDLTFVISADYARATGGWIYDERLLAGLTGVGWRIERLTLPGGFPEPSAAARAQAAASLRAVADDSLVLADQLCLGVLPEVARAEARRLRLAMIVHHPLALEAANRAHRAHDRDRLARSEADALSHVRAVIATSPSTARLLTTDYAVPSEKIIVAVPGVDRRPLARGSGARVQLVCVGAVVPRKDHILLIRALADLERLPWRLTIVGNLTRAAAHAGRVRGMIRARGLAPRIKLLGEVSDAELARLWSGADLYVAASRHEGYGMAIAEALAHGLPVVSTYAGAAGAWIGRRGARIVPGGRVAPLRAALRQVIANRTLYASLRREAIARRRTLPGWEATAAVVDRGLQHLVENRT
ncbi:MAG TPA: glycosyltransferase family 4 protein [Hyphomicrobiaceae bacterium]|nr:glycosyltransferase family 4 protein [Hyphomicrobiaceae bacterium]